jgi:hypothetical protein
MKHCSQFADRLVLCLHAKRQNIRGYVHITRYKHRFKRVETLHENLNFRRISASRRSSYESCHLLGYSVVLAVRMMVSGSVDYQL